MTQKHTHARQSADSDAGIFQPSLEWRTAIEYQGEISPDGMNCTSREVAFWRADQFNRALGPTDSHRYLVVCREVGAWTVVPPDTSDTTPASPKGASDG